jgi:superfamily II DNA or RNA helicase
MEIRIGQIVNMRKRLWRIDELSEMDFVATPITGDIDDKRLFLRDLEDIKPAELDPIRPDLIGDYLAQQMLLSAYRFDLMHGSAPFLALQRSAVIPYNYQLVPLILALENENARLLIADDVGLGKTIEAGLIISESMQRGKIKRVLILTPANLKDQWKESLDYFFHIDSKIISSLTRKEYEKQLPAGANPWQYFQVVIASVDYAKAPEVKHLIQEQKWDLLLIDEVHLCARPHASMSQKKQMKRYELFRDLSKRIPNVLLLTATPHNGYTDSFASILESLNEKIVSYGQNIRINKKEAKFNVVQRNRKNLEKWYEEQKKKSPFPERIASEEFVDVRESKKIEECFAKVLEYGDHLIAKSSGSKKKENIATWIAFHFQKRAISSPYALQKSIENRIESLLKKQQEDDNELTEDIMQGSVQDLFFEERITDEMASTKLDKEIIDEKEKVWLEDLHKKVKQIKPQDDIKLQRLKNKVLPDLFNKDKKIIVFTKYKDTLEYLVTQLEKSDFDVFNMHGELSLNKRQEIFVKFERSKKAILIATDVISEGLNLQRLASCIIHYELPWNPNRLEQRNGRVDRIGQLKEHVHIRTFILDNTLDRDILDLLIEKANNIRNDRGYSAAYFGDEDYIKEVLEFASQKNKKRKKKQYYQEGPNLLDFMEYDQVKDKVQKSFGGVNESERLKKIEQESFYDSLDIDLPEIDKRISETVSIVGSQTDVENFVQASATFFNSVIQERKDGFRDIVLNDQRLHLPRFGSKLEKITFDPKIGLTHPDAIVLEIGHPFIRRMIELVKSEFFGQGGTYGRSAFYFSDDVEQVSFIYNYLVRYTVGLQEKRVIEELLTIGFDGFDLQEISEEKIKEIKAARSSQTLDEKDFHDYVEEALKLSGLKSSLDSKVEKRRLKLIGERQELYKKIIKESDEKSGPKWVNDIMFIDLAGSDLLSVTIILPNSN